MDNKLDKKYARGEFIICFEDEVTTSAANYLIKKEGLKLKEEHSKIIIHPRYSNAYYVICLVDEEIKHMKLLSKKLNQHIKWTALINILLEERLVIIEQIKLKLEIMEGIEDVGKEWETKLNEVKSLLKKL